MCFEWTVHGWSVVYRRLDVWPFPRTSTFGTRDKLRSLFDRFAPDRSPKESATFEQLLKLGRGMVELELTDAQLAALKEVPEGPM